MTTAPADSPLAPRLGAFPTYDAFAERLQRSEVVMDAWVWGRPRFSPEPEVIAPELLRGLYRTAERVAAVYNEVCLIAADEPDLLERFFRLTPFQKAMWTSSAPAWHGVARADVFVTDEGFAITELNSDTPTGEAEAVTLGQVGLEQVPDAIDPNADLERTYLALAEALYRRLDAPGRPRTVGLVYPTEFTEDLSLIRLLRRWFEGAGWGVVLGSPFNLELSPEGDLLLFGAPVSLMVRHYKTDWWGERESAWDDDDYPDREPLRGPLGAVMAAQIQGRLEVLNPFGAVLPQNKRAMALMWEHLDRFSSAAQDTIRAHVPYTRRLETLHEQQLLAEQAEWVIKSDYGAEGDEVILGRLVSADIWQKTILHARPGRWVAQRYFEAQPDASGATANWGVYLIGGRARGVYLRQQRGVTDDTAFSVPVLVRA